MKRESHLFACHKFLEEIGSQLLLYIAKIDFRNLREVEKLCKQIENYITTIENHSQWEEEFIFNKFFKKNDVFVLFEDHSHLENKGKKIIEELIALLSSGSHSRIYKGKLIYLDFRIFHASNLVHFHSEETNFLSMLQEIATDDDIRAIDKPIYQDMSGQNIIEMLAKLFPSINVYEKKNILDDLKSFNPINFGHALPNVRELLSQEEINEILE